MTGTETVFLDLDDLLAAATAVLGDEPGVRDYGLLESALARPQATVFGENAYTDIHAKAAALLSSLVKNHALVDGNKRLGLVSVRLFYALNDHTFEATNDEKFDLVMSVAKGRLNEVEDTTRMLEQHTTPSD